jgi:hypothetical protein
MYYNNSMKVTLKNAEAATKALEVLRTRLIEGFECDNDYERVPSMMMLSHLSADNHTVSLPEDFSGYRPEDAEGVQIELLKHLALSLSAEDFSCEIYNEGEYSEGEVAAKYENGRLEIKAVFYPCGRCDFLACGECGEEVISIAEYEEGKTCICPECGEEIDLSEAYEECKPEIKEIVLNTK